MSGRARVGEAQSCRGGIERIGLDGPSLRHVRAPIDDTGRPILHRRRLGTALHASAQRDNRYHGGAR